MLSLRQNATFVQARSNQAQKAKLGNPEKRAKVKQRHRGSNAANFAGSYEFWSQTRQPCVSTIYEVADEARLSAMLTSDLLPLQDGGGVVSLAEPVRSTARIDAAGAARRIRQVILQDIACEEVPE
jgi:hypothetical protein